MKWTETKIVGFDTETTGLDPVKGRVLQFAFCLYDPARGEFTEQLVGECDTDGVPIEPGAQRAHGITAERVAGKPSFDTRLPEIEEFLRSIGGPWIPVAYNAPFDLAFLLAACTRLHEPLTLDVKRVLDPLPIARQLWKYGNKLTELCPRLGIVLDSAHDASFDARAAMLCELTFAKKRMLYDDFDKALDQQQRANLSWEGRTKHRYWEQYETALAALKVTTL